MKACLSLTDLDAVKGGLVRLLPDVKSSHRVEALARGLGFGSNAALRTALTEGPIEREVDEKAFGAYLAGHGFTATGFGALNKALVGGGFAFPPVIELPTVIDASRWSWQPFENRRGWTDGMWLATDNEQRVWLLKMRGARYAYREAVFARIAQRTGWSHQSSIFAILPDDAEPRRSARKGDWGAEEVQGASWFLKEHVHPPCGKDCLFIDLQKRLDAATDPAKSLADSRIPHVLDWVRAEVASHLFGANEMSGILFTAGHRLVLIDSEQLFSSGPIDPSTISWWKRKDGTVSDTAFALTMEVCKAMAGLTDADLTRCLAVPEGIVIDRTEEIRNIVFAARVRAAEFVDSWGRL